MWEGGRAKTGQEKKSRALEVQGQMGREGQNTFPTVNTTATNQKPLLILTFLAQYALSQK